MTIYYATIKHHSIGQAPVIKIEGTLRQAKRTATERFGDGYLEHEIIITGEDGDWVARRLIEDDRWTNRREDDPLIHRVGRALYGTEWQSDMARDLNINLRTIQRYAAGTTPPPAGVMSDLSGIIEDRIEVLGHLAEDIQPSKAD
ncbi:hypothetical protein FOH24_10495 [Acetobacter tropicalis]|nr:hypothetical protein [Acetobacter tropicalis]KAA8385465.1 hypothetical protein FOH22_13590 [Acetobacter tropicalis]KAA8389687.1 hypothetical protein FOH24_10495 [Acetobacter tropicalis]MBC9008812.1 hypothetical protein [Acetobacter tropicalis]MDO8171985.1 hypothetical protein [Acetobacter tropicalis]